MFESNHYILPTAGKKIILGRIFGAACAVEVATIINRHPGPVLLITTDMQRAHQLHDEIVRFTRYQVLILPDLEALPYDNFSPSRRNISERIKALYQLPTLTRGIVILPVSSLMRRVCPYTFFNRYLVPIKKGQHLSLNTFCEQLEQIGYRRVDRVSDYGEFTTHGTLLDLYPMASKDIYRIHFLNDIVNSLRIFDVNNQRTLHKEVISFDVLPAHEFSIKKASIELFCRQWREKFNTQHRVAHIYQQVSKGVLPVGIEYWQPLFFSEPLVPLFSYLRSNTLLINTSDFEVDAHHLWEEVYKRFNNYRADNVRPLLSPELLWLRADNLFAELKRWPLVQFVTQTLPKKAGYYNMSYQPLPDLMVETQSLSPLEKVRQFYDEFNGSVIFSVESERRRITISKLLEQVKILPILINSLEDITTSGAYFMIGVIDRGFIDDQRALALICEGDLLGGWVSSYRYQDDSHDINSEKLIRNLTELHEGQLVVHLEHGVGRCAGMTTLEVSGIKAEYLILTYADNDKLYVPISSLHLISRYTSSSDDNNVPLHKLGGDTWLRARRKAAEQVKDVVTEFLDIYAQRAAKGGFAFCYNQENYQMFCKEFPFKLTMDQVQAINSVLNDMCQPLPMDRLICGDVGFGKTEVAMRASFLAIENHKQVAVLVPTTLLAQQHFDNFRERFSNWPVCIEMLSRFRSARDQAQVLKQIAEGKVNILIGTHKILQSNIQWCDFGLLIVDEEHRFGVRHKERIKAMRANVDILTLTATPIPRTLNMAMSGMRDLSIIATSPPQRLAVKTFVCEYSTLVVREAILREVLRGGQVYYIYNNVKTIEKATLRLKALVPEARFAIGHGQMRERNLAQVMNDFHHQLFNVLVCTTIIETGIDIANVNTIIIERADSFGLAQLHQLRGRVGRSYRQAYAYFLTPPPKTLSQDAYKRLEAIAQLEDLGAGFDLAMHDLEIRGAGELLGEDQSGQMETIGFSLYMELLGNAVNAIKAGRSPSLEHLNHQLPEIELFIPTLLPEEYIPDINTRLSLYKRIASVANDYDIIYLKLELIDRFGLMPDPVCYLLDVASLRTRAQKLGIRRIKGNAKGGYIELSSTHRIDYSYLINIITHEESIYKLDGPTRLKFVCDLTDYTTRLRYVDNLLCELQNHTISSDTY